MHYLRKPTVADVPSIVALLEPHVLSLRLLPRTARQIVERLRDYTLAIEDGVVVGVASVSLVDTYLAEVGALAARRTDVEQTLLLNVLDEARAMGVDRAFVLTDDPALYEGVGFERRSLADLPEKRDRQCLRCARLPRCRQQALEVSLSSAELLAAK